MENHGCKGCLTPSLCIITPRTCFLLKRFFLFLLAFLTCLDKIKVGGDSCLTATFFDYKKSVHRITELATLLGMLSIKRGVTLEFRIHFNCLICLLYISKAVLGIYLCERS